MQIIFETMKYFLSISFSCSTLRHFLHQLSHLASLNDSKLLMLIIKLVKFLKVFEETILRSGTFIINYDSPYMLQTRWSKRPSELIFWYFLFLIALNPFSCFRAHLAKTPSQATTWTVSRPLMLEFLGGIFLASRKLATGLARRSTQGRPKKITSSTPKNK